LVRIIEEEAGHHAGVTVREGQHKSDSHLHESYINKHFYVTV
jgi:hypothetical protein